MGLDQLLKYLGFILYPLSFFLYSPFNYKKADGKTSIGATMSAQIKITHCQYLGYVTPMNAYLTGLRASEGLSPSTVLLAVHAGVASLIMFFSNMYINYYLDKHHNAEITRAERNNPSKKVFNLKSLSITVAMLFTALLVLIFFQQREQQFPIGGVMLSLLATFVNLHFAQKRQTVDYFVFYLQKQNFKLNFTIQMYTFPVSLNPIPIRVGPQPYPIEI